MAHLFFCFSLIAQWRRGSSLFKTVKDKNLPVPPPPHPSYNTITFMI